MAAAAAAVSMSSRKGPKNVGAGFVSRVRFWTMSIEQIGIFPPDISVSLGADSSTGG